jgi:hypothetical protein
MIILIGTSYPFEAKDLNDFIEKLFLQPET